MTQTRLANPPKSGIPLDDLLPDAGEADAMESLETIESARQQPIQTQEREGPLKRAWASTAAFTIGRPPRAPRA